MLATRCLKFDLTFFKILGYPWDVDHLTGYQIAYCIALVAVRKSYELYLFALVLKNAKEPNVDMLFFFFFGHFSYFLTTIGNIFLVILSMAHHRNTRRNLFERVEEWRVLLKDEGLIASSFGRTRRVIVLTTFLLVISTIAFKLYVYVPFKFEFTTTFSVCSGIFDRFLIVLQPKLFTEFLYIVILQFRVTNTLAAERKIDLKQLKSINKSLQENINLFNDSFMIPIFLEILKNFVIFIGYVFYFSQSLVGSAKLKPKLIILTLVQLIPSTTTFLLLFVAVNILDKEVLDENLLILWINYNVELLEGKVRELYKHEE